MRTILLLTLALAGCATDAADQGATEAAAAVGGTMELRTIKSGSQAAAEPEHPKAVLVRVPEDYVRVWESTVGAPVQLPAVDFTTETAVILLGGSRPTGGYSVEARGAKLDGQTLVVDAIVKAPPADAIVTQAFTSPFAVIAVKTRSAHTVRWNP